MAMQPMTPWTWVQSQFKTLRYPDEDCTGKTFIVTGANVGKADHSIPLLERMASLTKSI